MRCHSVGCGTLKFRTQSVTRNFAVDHITPVVRVCDEAGNVIETHDHKGNFKEP